MYHIDVVVIVLLLGGVYRDVIGVPLSVRDFYAVPKYTSTRART